MGAGKTNAQIRFSDMRWESRLVFGLIVSLLIQIIAGPVVGLFTTDAIGHLLGAPVYPWIHLGLHFCRGHFSFSGYFCAYRQIRISFIHNMIAIRLVRMPGVYLTSKLFPDTLFPMGLATATDSLLSVIICMDCVRMAREKGRKTKREKCLILFDIFYRLVLWITENKERELV